MPPASPPGNHLTLRAEMVCAIAFSACPQNLVPINGVDSILTEAYLQII
jgi:uncharacterized protein YcgI (DUF1989 family)